MTIKLFTAVTSEKKRHFIKQTQGGGKGEGKLSPMNPNDVLTAYNAISEALVSRFILCALADVAYPNDQPSLASAWSF